MDWWQEVENEGLRVNLAPGSELGEREHVLLLALVREVDVQRREDNAVVF
jgi:hypothetical protein